MQRSLRELIKDFESDPSQWEVIAVETLPSSNIRNRGGNSVQETLRHKTTSEEMVRHTLLKADGTLFAAPHFRPHWK